jgi:hypothetical protein
MRRKFVADDRVRFAYGTEEFRVNQVTNYEGGDQDVELIVERGVNFTVKLVVNFKLLELVEPELPYDQKLAYCMKTIDEVQSALTAVGSEKWSNAMQRINDYRKVMRIEKGRNG